MELLPMGRPPLDPNHGPMTPAERQARRRAGLTQPGKPSYQTLERWLSAMRSERHERQRVGAETSATIKRVFGEAVETVQWLFEEASFFADESKALGQRVRELEAERVKLVARIVKLEAQLQVGPSRKGTKAKAAKPK
jgi:hypothetical protein